MTVVKASSKGQVVIPKEVRDKLGIGPGSRMVIRVVGNHAELFPLPDDPIAALRGALKGGASMADELLEERMKDDREHHEDRS